jgi:EF hand
MITIPLMERTMNHRLARILTLTLMTTAVATAMNAYAGPQDHGNMRERMKAADTNGDGQISRAEAQALPQLAKNFDAIDTNKDGQVSPAEMRAMRDKMGKPRPDTDGDKRISREEAAKYPHLAKDFDKLDTNKDGYLSGAEMQAAKGKHAGKRFDDIDTDKDGYLSRAEVESRAPMMKDRFDALDTNRDGKLSKEELKAAHGHHGART